jgi:hypothetical protein
MGSKWQAGGLGSRISGKVSKENKSQSGSRSDKYHHRQSYKAYPDRSGAYELDVAHT